MSTPERSTPPRKLNDWVELISNQEMPIFDNTVHQVFEIARDELSPASALARVVLQDTSLTTRVLKLANSVYYNPMGSSPGGTINTVSRAVIVLGFNVVSNMCLTATLVDAVVKGAATRERVAREMAHALHAATQARTLAVKCDDPAPEEIFIATLLNRVGELAFWCFGEDAAEELEQLYHQAGMKPERAQRQQLGFTLQQLNEQLTRLWHLTDLTQQSILAPDHKDPRVQIVTLSHQIAECALKDGWQSEPMADLVQRTSRMLGLEANETRKLLHKNVRDAHEMAANAGAHLALPYIPQPDGAHAQRSTGHHSQSAAKSPFPEPDSSLQLRVLRELSMSIEAGKADLNLVMELVLEGIYRGVGMDRVMLALVSPDRRMLKARLGVGVGVDQDLIGRFAFTHAPNQPNLFFDTIEQRRALWFEQHTAGLPAPSRQAIQVLGAGPFMIAPLTIGERSIGLIYADRTPSKRELTQELFEDFKHLAHQASMGLTFASQRGRHA